MPRKHSFWRELPVALGFSNWDDLAVSTIAGLITAVVLGSIIGILMARGVGKSTLVLSIPLGILFFILIQSAKGTRYFFGFLYKYMFNK